MVIFDKDIVEDPVEDLDSVHIPNEKREGPAVGIMNSLIQHEAGGSYHNADAKRGHPSSADGCKRKNYLNYIHKLDGGLEVPENDPNSNRTFTHGDLVHEWIQGMLEDALGSSHIENEKPVSLDIGDDFYIYGHADIVITGLDDPTLIKSLLPGSMEYLPDSFNGFPDPFIIDIKTKSEFTYYDYSNNGHVRSIPAEKNIKQLNTYMGILDAQFGCLLYYSKRNDHIEEYWVEFDEELFQEAIEDIEVVLNAVNTGTPAPKSPDGEYMCEKFCKWHKEGKCPGVEGVEPHENWDGDEEEFDYEDPEWS